MFFRSDNTGTHSFRKGGATWLQHTAGVPEEVVQAQGGWACKDTMQRVYTGFTLERRRAVLLSQAASAFAAPGFPIVPQVRSPSQEPRRRRLRKVVP